MGPCKPTQSDKDVVLYVVIIFYQACWKRVSKLFNPKNYKVSGPCTKRAVSKKSAITFKVEKIYIKWIKYNLK